MRAHPHRRTVLRCLAVTVGLAPWSPSCGQTPEGSRGTGPFRRRSPPVVNGLRSGLAADDSEAETSPFHYEPDQIDPRSLTGLVEQHPGRASGGGRGGSRVLNTRPGGDVSRPQDEAPVRADGRGPQVRPDGSLVPTASGARIAPAPNGPTYPGSGGPEAPTNIPGFRR